MGRGKDPSLHDILAIKLSKKEAPSKNRVKKRILHQFIYNQL
jgi:hypothetical protein